MIQDLREQLCNLGRVLDSKKDEVCDMFDNDELNAYFRSRDSLKTLIPSLYDFEVALYKHKILL